MLLRVRAMSSAIADELLQTIEDHFLWVAVVLVLIVAI